MKTIIGIVLMFFALNIYAKKYASVDVELTIKTVKDGIRLRTKLEKEFKQKQKEIKAKEASIQKQTDAFRQKAKYLSPEKQQEKQQEIQKQMLAYREFVNQAQAGMQKKQMEQTKPIIESVKKVISEIAKKQKYELVFEKNQSGIFYAQDAEDITNKVIKRYNEIHK